MAFPNKCINWLICALIVHVRCCAEVIEKYRDCIRHLEVDVTAIEAAEKEEKELRLTELKANKAYNLLEHRDEILSRPKRSWFQTHSERMQDIGEEVLLADIM